MDEARERNRREFLQGKSARDALIGLAHRVAGGSPELPTDAARSGSGEEPSPAESGSAVSGPSRYQVHIGRRAMACQFEVFLNAGQYPHGTEAAIAALDLVDELEAQMTVYRDDSEVSRLNRKAGDLPVRVESRLFRLLARGVEIHYQTGGAYDLTSGALSKVWGFYRRAGSLPTPDDLAAALASCGTEHLELDPDRETVRFRRSGLEINLGSIGKGYALDRCAALLTEHGLDDFLIHGGQSSVLGRGSQGGEEGWIVGLRHPLRADRRLAEIRLFDQALGTSGSGTQFFLHEGRRYGHILDPRTGWPASGVLSATVIADNGADADALATAFYVLGIDGTADYCSEHKEVAAIIVRPGTGTALQIDAFGLNDCQWRLL